MQKKPLSPTLTSKVSNCLAWKHGPPQCGKRVAAADGVIQDREGRQRRRLGRGQSNFFLQRQGIPGQQCLQCFSAVSALQAGGKTYSPSQAGAFILQKLKADAEAYLGRTINEAVVTVPGTDSDNCYYYALGTRRSIKRSILRLVISLSDVQHTSTTRSGRQRRMPAGLLAL